MIKIYRDNERPSHTQIAGLHEEHVLHEKGGRFTVGQIVCDTPEEVAAAKKVFGETFAISQETKLSV
jgi:hypothetical protein